MNSVSTIRIIAVICLLIATGSAVLSQNSAQEVFARFCTLDLQGAQLTPDGWKEIAALFVNPGRPQRNRIIVINRWGPLGATPNGEKVGVGREYTELGQIVLPQMRFSDMDGLPAGAHIVEAGMNMVRISSRAGTEEWRIEGPVPQPLLTADVAIRYVTKIRADTKDATIARNADRTLAALRRLR